MAIGAGAHTIALAGTSGTDQNGDSSELACSGGSVWQRTATTWTLTPDATATSVNCTTVAGHEVRLGAATASIRKRTVGDDGGFNFTASSSVPGANLPPNLWLPDSDPATAGNDGRFSLQTSGGASSPLDGVFAVPAAPGYPARVVVREERPSGAWTFVDLQCQLNGGTPPSRFHINGNEVTMVLNDLDDARCTYTNRKRP